MTNEERIRLILDMGALDANVAEVTDELKKLDIQLEKTAAVSEKAATSTRNMGYAGLTAGRAIQDFAQGGIGGILNNIEGLTMALGGPAGLAGVLTAVGVAAFIAKPFIVEFWNGLDPGNKVPESTDNLIKLNDEIKRNSEELDKLKDKQSLSNTELARFNELTAKQFELERKAAEEKKARAQEAKMMELKAPGVSEAEAERGRIVSGQIGGEQEQLIGQIASALAAPVREAVEDEMAAIWKPGTPFGNLPAEARERYEQLARRQQQMQGSTEFIDQARRMVSEAAAGNADALQRIVNRLPAGAMRRGLAGALPEAMEAEAAEDRETEAGHEAAKAARLKRQARQKDADRNQKEADKDAEHWRKTLDEGDAKSSRDLDAMMRQNAKEDVRNARRSVVEKANKTQRDANQAVDDFMEMMRENGNVFNGVMYSVDQLRMMAYWAKRNAQEMAERSKQTVMGGGQQ